MEVVHANNIIHRDLKHLNILVSSTSGNFPEVKITDFGLAMEVQPTEFFVFNSGGTVGYLSPAAIQKQPCNNKVDIWALGIILYSMLCATVPFIGDTDKETNIACVNQELSFENARASRLSEDCKSLLNDMLNKDQSERASI